MLYYLAPAQQNVQFTEVSDMFPLLRTSRRTSLNFLSLPLCLFSVLFYVHTIQDVGQHTSYHRGSEGCN